MRRLAAVLALLLLPAAAQAQCVGGFINGCPGAVSPLGTDLLLGYQGSQNPHVRSFTLDQVLGAGLPAVLGATTFNAGGSYTGGTWTGTQSGAGASVDWGATTGTVLSVPSGAVSLLGGGLLAGANGSINLDTGVATLGSMTFSASTINFASSFPIFYHGTDTLFAPIAVTSPVANYIITEANATGAPPAIRAYGTDASISLNLRTRGTGDIQANGVPIASSTGDLGVATVTATGASIGDTLANRFADVLNLRHDCGAKGDGVTDDSGALKTCINAENTDYAAGKPAVIYVPAGIYLIKNTNGTMPAFAPGVPGAVVGAGQHKSYIRLDTSYAGPLFTWDQAWEGYGAGTIYNPGPFNPAQDAAGPLVRDLTISGSLSAASEQDGLQFYDENDHVLVEDVDFFFLPGAAISGGQTRDTPNALVRESAFRHVKMWFDGNASKAAFLLSNAGAADTTNDIVLDDINIYAFSSAGLTLTAPASGTGVAGIWGVNVRVEGNENGTATGNDINIGLPTDLGLVHSVRFVGLDAISPSTGHYGVAIDADASVQPYSIVLADASISPGNGGGLDINNARLVKFSGYISTTQTNVVVGSLAGSDIVLDGFGTEAGWTFNIPAANQANISFPTHNHATEASQAIDLQTGTRTATTHFASGTNAFATGHDNTASGTAAIAIGDTNVASGNYAAALGQGNTVSANTGFATGFGNSFTGSTNFGGGYQNILSGTLSSAPGGQAANDFGRYGWRGQANGDFSAAGDAQSGRMILRASTTSATQTELTADGTAAVTANIPSIQDNSAATVSVSVIARDVTTAGNSYSYELPAGLLTRGTGVASTAFATTSTANTGSTGTGSTAAVALAADTAAGGLAVKWTAPNTDTWHVVATVTMTEVQ